MDFRNFGPGGPVVESQSNTYRWWRPDCSDDDVSNAVSEALNALSDQQSAILTASVRDARLYGDSTSLSLVGLPAFRAPGLNARFGGERVTFNVVKSVIDTVVSKIGKHRPKPYFLTRNGDYRQQRKAKNLNTFCEGLFYENGAYQLGPVILRDACVWGDGIVHVFWKNGRICWERVFKFEIFVDEVEGVHGKPRQMYRLKDVDRGVLLEAFPDKRDVIEAAPKATYDNSLSDRVSDMVTVREAWHLPSKPGAKDGKHCISVQNGLLCDVEEWEHDFFPFVKYSWGKPVAGFWTRGIAAETMGIQLEINKLLHTIQKSYYLGGTFKLLVENGSKVVKEHLNNEIGSIVSYTGTRPDYITPPLVQPEIYNHLENLKRSAYEQVGVSMMSAASQKPLGIESGRAMRTLNDIESDRFHTFGKDYEQFFLDLAKMSIELVAHRGSSYKVAAPARGHFKEVDWADIDLRSDSYVMQCFPVSSLPSDPAGRLATIQEMIASGVMSPQRARRLLDFPDLDAADSLANAAEDYIEMVLDLIIEEGVYTPPEEFDDLPLAREMAVQQYNASRTQGLDLDRLALLRDFVRDVDLKLKEIAAMSTPPVDPMAAGAPPDMMGAPAGGPGLPPALPM